jgi:fibronectin-binding autotransporter adhesin
MMTTSVRAPGLFFLAAAALLVAADCCADSRYWSATSGDWSSTACWSLNTVPTSGDSASIVNGGTATITLAGATCSTLALGGGASGTIQMNSGSLVVSNPAISELIGNSAPGYFVQAGGTHSIANYLLLGYAAGGSGSYTLTGGSLSVVFLGIGNSASGSFSQSGGTCSVLDQLNVGNDTGSVGAYTLSGSGLLDAMHESIGFATTGVFTQSGGTNSVSTGLSLGENPGSAGTYNLNGGLLVLPGGSTSLTRGPGGASFNINGGTLNTGANFSSSVPMTFGAGSNAVFNTSGTLSSSLSGSGSLTKTGPGALVLSGTNHYSGGTYVDAGTLVLGNRNALVDGANVTVGVSSYFQAPVVSQPAAEVRALPTVSIVPEPGTLALLAAGVLLMLRRRGR